MLCYRCGSHVPDSSEKCGNCGQQLLAGSARRASSAFQQRRRAAPVVDGAPYRTGDLIAGRYEVKEIAGAGPVGFLFRARDKQLDVEVAVKVVHARLVQTDEERETFSRVIRLGRKLSHQNLARANDDGEERGYPFFTTSYLDGLSLRKIIDLRQSKGQVFTIQEVEPILGQIASGLAGAHKVGPHADLKPENVIILPDLLKITDFSLGAALPRVPFMQAQKTRKVDAYFAPEFAKGSKPDARTDTYAMGVILGEMLTGVVPEGQQVPELTRRRPELPSAVEGLYRRALNENPDSRFQTPGELYQEFCAMLARVTGRPRGEPVAPPPPEPPRPAAVQPRPVEKPVPAISPSSPTREERPPDATQPVDAAMLQSLLAAKDAAAKDAAAKDVAAKDVATKDAATKEELPAPDATQPFDASMLPLEANEPTPLSLTPGIPSPSLDDAPPGPTAPQRARRNAPPVVESTQPLERSHLPLLRPNPDNSPTQAMDSSALPPLRAEPESASRQSKAVLWLVLLTIIGLLVGTAGGYLLLQARRHAHAGEARGAGDEPTAGAGSCPAGMVLVPAGNFRMGTPPGDGLREKGFDERDLAPVEVPAFCIDEFEFPNRAGAKPRANVSWSEAKAKCEGLGRRLCAEQEWEKACKGPGNSRFPYGEAFDPDACNTKDAARVARDLAESGRFAKCRSGYGVVDLSGNLAEWTSTPYAPGQTDMTLKGGSFDRPDYAARCSARREGVPGSSSPQVGFRCCLDAQR